MRNGSVNIEVLGEFIYLADSLSFRATADHFYVSRSVISRHMTALEESIGARLFERESRKVMLTEAGRVFYRDVKTTLTCWESALEHVRDAHLQGAAVVRVGYLRNAARPVIVPFARRMAREYPGVHVDLSCMDYAELRRAMDERMVDIAVAMNVNPAISRNYRSTRIYEDDFRIVCALDHPLAHRKGALSLDELTEYKILLPDSFRDIGLGEIADALISREEPSTSQYLYRDFEMLYLKVLTEGYVAFSSSFNGSAFGSQVVMIPLSGVNTSFAVSAFYQDGLAGQAYRACRESFEWCSASLR